MKLVIQKQLHYNLIFFIDILYLFLPIGLYDFIPSRKYSIKMETYCGCCVKNLLMNNVLNVTIFRWICVYGASIYYILKNFPDTNISYSLIHSRTGPYHGVKNISYWERFAYVLNEWSPIQKIQISKFGHCSSIIIFIFIIVNIITFLPYLILSILKFASVVSSK